MRCAAPPFCSECRDTEYGKRASEQRLGAKFILLHFQHVRPSTYRLVVRKTACIRAMSTNSRDSLSPSLRTRALTALLRNKCGSSLRDSTYHREWVTLTLRLKSLKPGCMTCLSLFEWMKKQSRMQILKGT